MKSRFTRRQPLAATAIAFAPLAAATARPGVPEGALAAVLLAWAHAAIQESNALHVYNEMIGLDDADPAVRGRSVWPIAEQQKIFDRAVAASRAHRAAWFEVEDLLFGFHGGYKTPSPAGYLRPPLG